MSWSTSSATTTPQTSDSDGWQQHILRITANLNPFRTPDTPYAQQPDEHYLLAWITKRTENARPPEEDAHYHYQCRNGSPNWSSLAPYESTSLLPLVAPVGGLFLAFLVLRFLAFNYVYPPIAKKALGPHADPKNVRKFYESAWRTVLYGFSACWCVSTLLLDDFNYSWVVDSSKLWLGWPRIDQNEGGVREIYIVYFAMYLHELVFVFIDSAGDDFVAMVTHHIVTMTLLLASWLCNLTRIGALITILHDVSDLLLQAAKCFNYAKVLNPRMELVADALFVGFAISFYWLRLGIFPMYPLYSVFSGEVCRFIACIEPPFTMFKCWSSGVVLFFLPLLTSLQVLQIFWGWKLAKAVYRKVVLGKLEDVRDD